MEWTFDRKLFIIALGIGLIISLAACSKDQGASRPGEIVIKPTDVDFPGMQMRPGGDRTSFTLIGRIRNRSAQATLTEVKLRMTMEDVLASGASTSVAETTVIIRQEVPPAQSREFEEKVLFGDLPMPRGRLEWSYSVVELKSK
jgi:hypothetical protein